MEFWVQECRNCGYVSKTLEEKAPVERDFLSSEEYLGFEKQAPLSDLGELPKPERLGLPVSLAQETLRQSVAAYRGAVCSPLPCRGRSLSRTLRCALRTDVLVQRLHEYHDGGFLIP